MLTPEEFDKIKMHAIDSNEFIWTEKYRPQTVKDLIFPKKDKDKFNEWIEQKEIPNLGVFGSEPGTGKSSFLNVLIKELQTDTQWINGSKENGIDAMRMKIGNFATSMSVTGKIKLICMDEADYLTLPAQSTLRSDIEQFSKNARFVFTGNYPDKLIKPLLDRLQIYNLDDIYQNNKAELGLQIVNRLKYILEMEKVEYKQEDVLKIVKTLYPSTRNMIQYLQQNTVNNKLVVSSIASPDSVYTNLLNEIKSKNFKKVRPMINDILIPDNFYTYVWKNMDKIFPMESQPAVIVLLADYQDMSQRAKNKHIPLAALVTKMMLDTSVNLL